MEILNTEGERTMSEVKRDLAADLAMCEAATAGPWEYKTSFYGWMRHDVIAPNFSLRLFDRNKHDIRFIAEARTGWPHAIERAIAAESRLMAAEAEVERLRRLLPVTDEQAAETMRREREQRIERKVREILDSPSVDRRRREAERQFNELHGGERK